MEAKPRAGDKLLDRYLPDASPEQRERAREALFEYARVLEALGERMMRESRDSALSASQDIISSISPTDP